MVLIVPLNDQTFKSKMNITRDSFEMKRNETIKKLKLRFTEILSNTTCHAIQNIMRTNNVFLKFMWIAFFKFHHAHAPITHLI